MKINNQLKLAAAVAAGIALVGCGSDDDETSSFVNPDKAFDCTAVTTSPRTICIGAADDLTDSRIQTDIQNALLDSQSNDTIVFPAGRYNLSATISFQGQNESNETISGLTFKGAGMDQTIFDGSHEDMSDAFLFNNTDGLVFEDFGVYESNNNALKVINGSEMIFRRVATVWETDYQEDNGAYGLYPVQSDNILIEDCYVQGSADAGVYVGQSDRIVVRDTIAVKNVAGIEIENSTNADVYGNTARGNTGGVLVFDLPIGNGKYGSGVRVFDNIIEANNAPNFAKTGTFAGGVHIVPPGTGVIILATNDVEIFDNTITDHQTFSVAVSSYFLPDDAVAAVPNTDIGGADGDDATEAVLSYGDISPYATKYLDGWSPFLNGINIHDNTITVAEGINNPQGDLITDIIGGFTLYERIAGLLDNQDNVQLPHIVYDGVAELLATTTYPVQADIDNLNTNITALNAGGFAFTPLVYGQATMMEVIATTTEVTAAGLWANVLFPMDNTTPMPGSISATSGMEQWDGSRSMASSAGSVCQSGNGVDGMTILSASMYDIRANANSFDESGNPVSKVEQALGGVSSVEVLNDTLLSCDNGAAYIGTEATVEIAGTEYGCTVSGDDHDTSSTTCAN